MDPEQGRRWLLVAELADRLAGDEELAEEFERTPGKVLRALGVEPDELADMLLLVQRARERGATPPDDR